MTATNELHTGTKYSGAKWFHGYKPQELSPLAIRISNLIGQIYEGVYNVEHSYPQYYKIQPSATIATISLHSTMATYDGDKLTRLFLCSQAASLEIAIAGGIGSLRVTFKDVKTSESNPVPTISAIPEMTGFEDLMDAESPEWRSLIGRADKLILDWESQWLYAGWNRNGTVSGLCIRSAAISMERLAEIVARAHSSCCRAELEGRCPVGRGQIGLSFSARSRSAVTIMDGHPNPAEGVEKLRKIWDIDYESLL